ncbi:Lrp/AsnC family transcriptional regulator [Haloactinomyces albus]|uniref:DNA-binding Lrp family transcriptional regulator n=1 Tax=Haloactinomyces albus TaxID=1352928 RepID=A0AAE3ZFP1_9ACTN|nr:Lrp/AsnC family transcriptional regulator [Haloactinomyces albus]MDR7304101.1 DNA-binding Lrp family transcriptional regulator [Haloactinomyces albus]
MSFSAVTSPDSGARIDRLQDSAVLGETDLALIEALQVRPRAPWTRIAPALGLDATTAARRWHRLTDNGLAWLTAYPAPPVSTVGYVDVSCRPDALENLTERLRTWPCVFSIDRTTGEHQLVLSVVAPNLPALDAFLSEGLARLDGVRSVRLGIGTRFYREGSDWLVRALDQQQRSALVDNPARGSPSRPAQLRESDRALLLALSADARRSCADLAQDSGLSETTVRRRLSRMIRNRELYFRCDLAQRLAGWHVIATYRMDAPADRLSEVGQFMAALPETRLCAAVTGECNLLLSAWLRSSTECASLEERLLRRFPELDVTERNVTLHTVKRMGRLLNTDGVTVGHVPIGFRQSE